MSEVHIGKELDQTSSSSEIKGFDPDKRIDINKQQDITNLGFDPDKRIDISKQQDISNRDFDPDKRISSSFDSNDVVKERKELTDRDNNDKLSIEQKQRIVDNAAIDYNQKYHPYENAIKKCYYDVRKTKNGGISFARSESLYITETGKKGVVKIESKILQMAMFGIMWIIMMLKIIR